MYQKNFGYLRLTYERYMFNMNAYICMYTFAEFCLHSNQMLDKTVNETECSMALKSPFVLVAWLKGSLPLGSGMFGFDFNACLLSIYDKVLVSTARYTVVVRL